MANPSLAIVPRYVGASASSCGAGVASSIISRAKQRRV